MMEIHARVSAVALAAVVTLWPAPALAQPPSPTPDPVRDLPARGPTAESLVPAGWTIEQRHEAEFSGDKANDVLLLLRRAADGPTPQRILVVALATAKPPGYARHSANARIIPRDPTGRLEDPMVEGGIVVRSRGFDLTLGMVPGAGSYQMATIRFRFRFEAGCFRLIGYDRAETHRATLETRDVSVNFLTGGVIQTTGNAQSTATQTRRTRLATNPRRCLPQLPDGWMFDPLASSPPPSK